MADQSPDAFMAVYERYAARFAGTLPDMRGMAAEDYYRLPKLMLDALDRGTPITDADLVATPIAPDPVNGVFL